jgi:hypothetical protein
LYRLVSDARQAEAACKKALDATISKADFLNALAIGLDGQEKISPKELEVICKWLKRMSKEKETLISWYDKAQQRLHYEKTGEKTGRTSLRVLVQLLNGILRKYTGDIISTGKGGKGERNYFDYVSKVCVIAKPGLLERRRAEKEDIVIKPMDRAKRRVKRVIEEFLRDYNSEQDVNVIEGWEQLMPGWKSAKKLSLRTSGVRLDFMKAGIFNKWRLELTNRAHPSVWPVMFPLEPFISRDVARRQSKLRHLPDNVWTTPVKGKMRLVFSAGKAGGV